VISGHTQVFALLGHPVRHSLSPRIYTHWFQAHDIDAVYVALEIDRLDLGALPLAGVNLTVPFKSDAVGQLDTPSERVQQLDAANTVVIRNGRSFGYNTDVYGFTTALKRDLGAEIQGRHVIILGAGGAARAVASGCAEEGAAAITFANRTPARRRRSVARMQALYPTLPFSDIALSARAFARHAPHTHLIINCTSGGAAETVRRFDVSSLPHDAIWMDLNYWMPNPPQIDACRQRGLTTQDGVSMLIHQASRSFQEFTGTIPDVTELLLLLRSRRRT
jgi:shikimate dehydrogenase